MAKAAEVDLRPDLPFAEAAARAVRVRADEVFSHAEGVLDATDIERVHDMRVATRRLRAALEVFAPCFPRSEHRSVLREVKTLADALGERRDPDVQLEALAILEQRMADRARPGLEAFAGRLRDQQRAANEALAAALAHAEQVDLRGRLRALTEGAQP